MTEPSLNQMTIDELVAEYNRLGPVEPLEQWDGIKAELVEMVRVARKQSTPNGLIEGVTVAPPDDAD